MLNFLVHLSIMSGGLIPLMALVLLLTIAVIVERFHFFTRVLKAGDSLEHDLLQMNYGSMEDLGAVHRHYASAFQANLVKAAMEARGGSADTVERQIEEAIMWLHPKLDRNMWLLDTSVTLGPLLGLLGTIIGMIDSFNVLGTQGVGNPNAVTGGIGHALIATGLGLVIAIVAVVFLNFFNKRLRLTLHQMDLIKTMLINRLFGGGSASYGRKAA